MYIYKSFLLINLITGIQYPHDVQQCQDELGGALNQPTTDTDSQVKEGLRPKGPNSS